MTEAADEYRPWRGSRLLASAVLAALLFGGCGLSDYQKRMASEQKRLEKHDKPSTKTSGKATKP